MRLDRKLPSGFSANHGPMESRAYVARPTGSDPLGLPDSWAGPLDPRAARLELRRRSSVFRAVDLEDSPAFRRRTQPVPSLDVALVVTGHQDQVTVEAEVPVAHRGVPLEAQETVVRPPKV